jgi:hypothetical protein
LARGRAGTTSSAAAAAAGLDDAADCRVGAADADGPDPSPKPEDAALPVAVVALALAPEPAAVPHPVRSSSVARRRTARRMRLRAAAGETSSRRAIVVSDRGAPVVPARPFSSCWSASGSDGTQASRRVAGRRSRGARRLWAAAREAGVAGVRAPGDAVAGPVGSDAPVPSVDPSVAGGASPAPAGDVDAGEPGSPDVRPADEEDEDEEDDEPGRADPVAVAGALAPVGAAPDRPGVTAGTLSAAPPAAGTSGTAGARTSGAAGAGMSGTADPAASVTSSTAAGTSGATGTRVGGVDGAGTFGGVTVTDGVTTVTDGTVTSGVPATGGTVTLGVEIVTGGTSIAGSASATPTAPTASPATRAQSSFAPRNGPVDRRCTCLASRISSPRRFAQPSAGRTATRTAATTGDTGRKTANP